MTKTELIEELADIEHQRWSDWQKWVHESCGPDPTHSGKGALLILPDNRHRWDKLIATDYADLPEHSKQADRDQVMRYWPLIAHFVAQWLLEWGPEGESMSGTWLEDMT